MRFTLELPIAADVAAADVRALATAAERAGFAVLAFTDHPAPSAKWLRAGGHATFDPFAALAFAAAVTSEVRLMTHLAVLPYRNPLLLAKSVATVDRLADGRFTLAVGTGYLRSEFAALGRSFEDRNADFEEAIEVLRSTFVGDDFTYEGRSFTALGVGHSPKPVQLPHPPIWVGGSSRASRQRVARFGDGWTPLFVDELFAKTVRTAPLSSDDDLARAIDELHALVIAEGRDPEAISIQLDGVAMMEAPAEATTARVAELEILGVTHVVTRPPHGSTAEAIEAIERFGADQI
jgi:probable F420-dependent oxidoreductase